VIDAECTVHTLCLYGDTVRLCAAHEAAKATAEVEEAEALESSSAAALLHAEAMEERQKTAQGYAAPISP
jgi:hypothetical protein